MNHERALLSQILQDNDVYYKINPQIWWFTVPEHKAIFGAITQLLTDATAADVINVGMQTKPALVSEIYEVAQTTKNASYYAELCKKTGGMNELKKLTNELNDKIREGDFDGAIEGIDSTTERILMQGSEYSILKLGDKLNAVVDAIEDGFKNKGQLHGISTGFPAVDEITGGLQPERLYVIGARPSQGKSALMLNMASEIAKTKSVGILSLESSWREILLRELAGISNVNSQRLLSGFMTESDLSRVFDAASSVEKKQLYVYDKPNCSLTEIVGQCRRLVTRHKVEVIFIDYLQLIQVASPSDRERVVRASNRVKDLSRELKIPIVVLAQLRRDSEGRRPGLGDFQHSSQIEQDADVAMLIYHRVVDGEGKRLAKSKPETEEEKVEIFTLIDKNRDGRTGAVPMYFDAEHVRFKEIQKGMDR